MGQLNIEIKARSSNHEEIRGILKSKKADFMGVDHQIDTYFKAQQGRLKLREGNIENYLIYYDRKNKLGPKESNVILFKSSSDLSLKEILFKSLEKLTVVDKKREIYFIDNVKIHLDEVKGQGTFVEIEAIDETGKIPKEKLQKQCQFYLELFKVKKEDLIDCSYSDMTHE